MELLPDEGYLNGLCEDCGLIASIAVMLSPHVKDGDTTVAVHVTEQHVCAEG